MNNYKIVFVTFFILALTVGCSGLVNRSRIHFATEEILLKAGFKRISVNEEQATDLAGFPAGKISSLQRHGTIYYIYPDLKHHRLLMGGENELASYHQLVTQQLIPFTSSSSNLERDWTESGVWKN